MNLTVCFKTIPDYGMIPPAHWRKSGFDPETLRVVRQVFNGYEESALEMALVLGEPRRFPGPGLPDAGPIDPDRSVHSPVPVKRTALTVDDGRADLFLRHLYAVGYDRAVRVAPDTDLDFFPDAVARIIAAWAARKDTPDLMIFSPRGGTGEHCRTGPLVAEMLGWPCLMSVAALDFDKTGSLVVTCRTDRTWRIHTVVPPLVLVTGIAADTRCLRIPTLKQKLAARKRPVPMLSPVDLGLCCSDPEKMELLPDLADIPASHRTCTLIHGDSPREKARVLADKYLIPEQVP